MNATSNNTIEFLNQVNLYLFKYIAPIIFIIGNIENFFSIFIFLKKSWRKNVCVFYFLICLLFYVGFYFSTLLPTFLILASIDRLLISSQNVDTRLYSSKRFAYFLCCINTFFWLTFFLHILIRVNFIEV
ncbi:hypothetical protein I4U23_016066 [Adineta vaga]|nr:hypothetical protein I4U23_016066 [Adineta vaga]